LIVADYFTMLRAELAGAAYSKADHRRKLLPALGGRSEPSVEFKRRNVSAVLVGMGLPYVAGYRPARNYQKALLPGAAEGYLAAPRGLLEVLAEAPLVNPAGAPEVGDRPVGEVFEAPPDSVGAPAVAGKPWLSRRGRRIDFARRDAQNR